MKEIFVDTSAWDALADAGDPNHARALQFRDEIVGQCRLVISDYVLDELYTLLLLNVGYAKAVAFKRDLDVLRHTGVLEVVWTSETIANEAWIVFKKCNVDKQWSYTDCVSYVVMKQRGMTEAFAFDHHFEQMGFVRHP